MKLPAGNFCIWPRALRLPLLQITGQRALEYKMGYGVKELAYAEPFANALDQRLYVPVMGNKANYFCSVFWRSITASRNADATQRKVLVAFAFYGSLPMCRMQRPRNRSLSHL
jgi:hypothetical protein